MPLLRSEAIAVKVTDVSAQIGPMGDATIFTVGVTGTVASLHLYNLVLVHACYVFGAPHCLKLQCTFNSF